MVIYNGMMNVISPLPSQKSYFLNTQKRQRHFYKYEKVFRDLPHGRPPDREVEHNIVFEEGTSPIQIPPYRHPKKFWDEIYKSIRELLDLGLIIPSSIPYASSVVLVKKKDGILRMCIDFRDLNKKTIKNRYPIPRIDELFRAKYFSKINLRSGYHQIRVKEEDVQKTAFRCDYGHFEFLVMPFGLTNALAKFQACMNIIFCKQLRRFVLAFFDDILIYSKTWEEYLQHLEIVLKTLQEQSLYVNMYKCEFGMKELLYIGNIIGKDGVKVHMEKMRDIL